ANHDRHAYAELFHGGDHAHGQNVAAQDAPENIDQHRAHVLVRYEDLERVANLFLVGAAAHIEEIRGLAAGQLDDVHRRHGQPGAVYHAADRAIEADVVQVVFGCFDLEWIFFLEVAELLQLRVPRERAV